MKRFLFLFVVSLLTLMEIAARGSSTAIKIDGLFLVLLFFNNCMAYSQEANSIVSMLQREPDEEFMAIRCDNNWENSLHFATILEVDNKYIMYYRANNKEVPTKLIYCYAESKDGIRWTKPNLGFYEYAGSTNNNIISDRFNGVSVEYKDSTFYLLADRIYDAGGEEKRGLYLFESKDGIHFIQSGTPAPMHCDTQNQLMWDKWTQTYKWYLRSWSFPITPKVESHHRRERYRNVSLFETPTPDVSLLSDYYLSKTTFGSKITTLKTEFPVVIQNVKKEDFDIYNPCVHQYREDLYIAYPTYYYHIPDIAHGGKKDNDGYGRIAMWVSSDGEHFYETKDDYMTNEENWLEFCIGHVETSEYYIHYYITFDRPHAWSSKNNSIRGRIHYKKQ